mmetsp:Transcript_33042/g.80315  ORF Transcript_33042/g.80315 Transcript_33042/m.80315 type:complete len:81 (+) Transcript_33042:845-1087(+)
MQVLDCLGFHGTQCWILQALEVVAVEDAPNRLRQGITWCHYSLNHFQEETSITSSGLLSDMQYLTLLTKCKNVFLLHLAI